MLLLLLIAVILAAERTCQSVPSQRSKLVIPSLMPVNNGIVAAPACLAAMQVVVDHVNGRNDILPGYYLTIQAVNEGPGAQLASQSFVNFLRNFDERKESNSNTFLSPIALGPTAACQSVAYTMKMLRFTEIAEQCNGPYLTARKKQFSNLFSMMIPAASNGIPAVLFQLNKGGWKQAAILTDTGNINDYLTAQALQGLSIANGIDILYFGFDEGNCNTDTMTMIKQSGARVVNLVTAYITMAVAFLCQTHAFGMRAPQYVLFIAFGGYFAPDSPSLNLPPGCTRDMIYEQAKITFFFGLARGTLQTTMNTSLGYNATWFMKQVDNLLNASKAVDDDNRALCHDAMLTAIFALDKSDSILRDKFNSSLKDFNENPEIVRQIVNATVADVDVVGLRNGRIRYSSTLDIDSDRLWVGQWDQSMSDLRMIATAQRKDKGTSLSAAAYQLVELSKPKWVTRTGEPPKDLSQILHIIDICPNSVYSALTALAAVATFVQILQIFFASKHQIRSHYFDVVAKCSVFLGCFLLNTACVILVMGEVHFALEECKMRFVLTTLGITFIDTVLFTQTLSFAYLMKMHNRGLVTYHITGTGEVSIQTTVRPTHVEFHRSVQRTIRTVSLFIVLLTALILAIWLIGVNPAFLRRIMTVVQYDEISDAYFDIISLECSSSNMTYWLGTLLAIHASLLIASCFFSYRIGHLAMPLNLHRESRSLRLSTVNATIMFFTILVIVIVFASSNSRRAWLPNAVLAGGNVVFSLSTSSLLFSHQYNWRQQPLVQPNADMQLTENRETVKSSGHSRSRGKQSSRLV